MIQLRIEGGSLPILDGSTEWRTIEGLVEIYKQASDIGVVFQHESSTTYTGH